jgi:hypothetical protein
LKKQNSTNRYIPHKKTRKPSVRKEKKRKTSHSKRKSIEKKEKQEFY